VIYYSDLYCSQKATLAVVLECYVQIE
jgi:hypothetical protein